MSIAENVQVVRERIAHAAARAQRSVDEITLVAVSKQKPLTAIAAAYEAGLRHFGENRSAELREKSAESHHLPEANWHFIGQLQTRQSLPVAETAAAFHAVDRLKIAQRLSRQLVELARDLPVFIEVNVSGEGSKGGFDCSNWQSNSQQLGLLLETVTTIHQLPRIEVVGLMTMAPWGAAEDVIRPIFSSTRQLSEKLSAEIGQPFALSMGMTDDYEIAIAEGSTHIRVGRALFGARNY